MCLAHISFMCQQDVSCYTIASSWLQRAPSGYEVWCVLEKRASKALKKCQKGGVKINVNNERDTEVGTQWAFKNDGCPKIRKDNRLVSPQHGLLSGGWCRVLLCWLLLSAAVPACAASTSCALGNNYTGHTLPPWVRGAEPWPPLIAAVGRANAVAQFGLLSWGAWLWWLVPIFGFGCVCGWCVGWLGGFLFPDRIFSICRKCGLKRLSKPRHGWRKRHLTRCAFVSCPPRAGDLVQDCQSSYEYFAHGQTETHFVHFFQDDAQVGPPVKQRYKPTSMPTWRGGAQGSTVTKKKKLELELLQGLTELMKKFDTSMLTSSSDTRTGKGKGSSQGLGSDVGLLNALKRLVQRASKNPDGLLRRLKDLVTAADKASHTGQTLNPKQKGASQADGKPHSTGHTKGKGKKGVEGPPQNPSEKGQGKTKTFSSVTPSKQTTDWQVVGRRGKVVSGGQQKEERLRLREQDWVDYVVVQSGSQFGAAVDKHGCDKVFCVLVHSVDELLDVLGVFSGDKQIKGTVVFACAKNQSLQFDEFPGISFKLSTFPLRNSQGAVVSKTVAIWSIQVWWG